MSSFKKDVELVKLDGTIIRSDGSTYKSDFFKFLELNPDDYSDVTYTPEEASRIRSHLLHMSTGASAAVPMICAGEKCIIADRCPFIREDRRRKKEDPTAKRITPVGKSCLVEKNLLNEWTRLYVESFNVPENGFIEIQYCQELAEIELLLWRLNNTMAKPENSEMIQEDIVGSDREGNILIKKSISSIFEAKEKLANRKSKIIKLMVGDRQEQYKREAALKMRDTADPSTQSAQLRGRLTKLLDEAKDIDLKLKEAEGKVIDIDNSDSNNLPKQKESSILTPEDLINQDSDE